MFLQYSLPPMRTLRTNFRLLQKPLKTSLKNDELIGFANRNVIRYLLFPVADLSIRMIAALNALSGTSEIKPDRLGIDVARPFPSDHFCRNRLEECAPMLKGLPDRTRHRIKKTLMLLQNEKGTCGRRDVVKVKLECKSQAAIALVVVRDPILTGLMILDTSL